MTLTFHKWWDLHPQRDENESPGSDADLSISGFHTPNIIFDHALAEMRVQIPRQCYPKVNHSADVCSIELITSDSGVPSQIHTLQVYKYGHDFFETEPIEFSLPAPSERYDFRLKTGDRVLRTWNIPGMNREKPYMAFEYGTEKLITNGQLPRKDICLVTYADCSLKPSKTILESAHLYGQWRSCKYFALNLDNANMLSLIDAQGQELSIPISGEKTPEIELLGGQVLECVASQGNRIYVDKPPNIRIPVQSEIPLGLWKIFIRPHQGSIPEDSKYCRLSELLESANDGQNKLVEICLADERLLGPNSIGRFTVRLRGPHRVDECFTFCILPGLKIEFDEDIYLPFEETEARELIVLVGDAEDMEFEPSPPARLIDKDENSYYMQVESAENLVQGMLHYHLPGKTSCQLPITIHIPKIQWRLQGLASEWRDRIEELPFDDWEETEELFLDIRMPRYIEGSVRLVCDSQEDIQKLRKGEVRFEVHKFNDTLRSDSNSKTFEITIVDSESGIENFSRFRVGTRWVAESIRCVQKIDGMDRILSVSWTEKRKTDQDRIVRLWKLWDPEAEPIKEIVEVGSCEVIMQDPPAGDYRVQVDVIDAEDLWSSTEAIFPSEQDPNTKDVTIEPRFHCKQCNFFTFDKQGMVTHVKEEHIESFVQHLTYEEIRQEYHVALPKAIYKCAYCDFYCGSSSYPTNPTSEVSNHVEECRERKGRGKVFRIIQDTNEIRERVIHNLPYLYKCSKCGYRFRQYDLNTVMRHLIEEHKDDLYSIQ